MADPSQGGDDAEDKASSDEGEVLTPEQAAAYVPKPSVGGTIRHNCSTAQLLSDEKHLELRQWAARSDGPWAKDVAEFPCEKGGDPSGEPYHPVLHGLEKCELYRNDYLAWCGSVQLPDDHPDFNARHFSAGWHPGMLQVRLLPCAQGFSAIQRFCW
eukprot:gnl/MRDRNA2_/MRDRNA2_49686_c0_seq2.p1 gnl/MRDRNA2_/MRDRNA2_49686_c0~~gnl/MRDRNA2_/MRDRNA2_49686_c0_seq2.p1  ORF type:complete len:157 (+),score=31.86 gnl/MRDRNA2_/MRDRNA2_49686_c0_seq2:141-611(+)